MAKPKKPQTPEEKRAEARKVMERTMGPMVKSADKAAKEGKGIYAKPIELKEEPKETAEQKKKREVEGKIKDFGGKAKSVVKGFMSKYAGKK